ncbi:segmentation protein cap'n'collar [Trichonephila clavipes]|nr:segmentation protein cap'n'collar [Trichonephila clavipes]
MEYGVRLHSVTYRRSLDIFNEPDFEPYKEEPIPACVPDPLAGLNYTIDGETGECVFEELRDLNNEDVYETQFLTEEAKLIDSCLLEENETMGALSHDSYLPFNENDEFCDLTDVFSPTQLTQLFSEDISVDSDYLSQIEDLGRELEQFETLNESNGTSSTVSIIK